LWLYESSDINKRREARERSGGTWSVQEKLALRQQRAAPVMAAFKASLDSHALTTPPKSALARSDTA
jgi:hypothetical protein